MIQGQTRLLLLTAIFVVTEVFFNYVMLTNGDGGLFDLAIKTLSFLLFILLFSRKLAWARWTLSIGLVLYGSICLVIGFELMAAFYLVGIFDIFFGVYIHTSEALGIYRNGEHETTHTDNPTAPTHKTIPAIESQPFRYPLLVRRFKAIFIDSVLVMATLIIIMVVVQDSDLRTPIMLTSAAILLSTYEPLLTRYSRTLGQRLMKIRVVRYENPSARINLLNAYIRWFAKGLLGWLSFVTIHFNPERRAIHDLASSTVMVCDEQKLKADMLVRSQT